MSKENKKLTLSSASSRGFQSWWTEEYGMISSDDKAACVLCCNKVVCRTSSVERHFETNYEDLYLKTKKEQREIISKAYKKKMQLSNLMKFIEGSSDVTAASYIVSKEIAKHVKPFGEGHLSNKHGLNVHRFYSKILKKKKQLFRE